MIGRLVAVVLLCSLVGCAGVRVASETHGEVDFAGYVTYAWSGVPAGGGGGADVEDPAVEARFRTAIREGLEGRGLREVPQQRADLLVGVRVWVEEAERASDPYFTGNPSERIELGLLAIELFDVVAGAAVWDGTARVELRELSRGIGVGEPVYRPVDQDREWPIERMVDRLLGRLPAGR